MVALATLPGAAQEFLQRGPKGLFIGGDWTGPTGGGTFDTHDPGTGEALASVPEATEPDVDAAVAAAAAAFPQWSSEGERGHLLWKLAELLEQRADDFAVVESLDNGKPLGVARHWDVPQAAATLRYFAGLADKSEGRVLTPAFGHRGRHHVYTKRVPLGVVAGIIPWNAPLLTATWKMGPALASGNTVVLKPAEQTPLSALMLAELSEEAGLPAGVFNVVTGFGPTAGAALARHPGVAKVSFTGSTEVGRDILRGSAADFKRVSVELGGKSSTIVLADAVEADLRRAANNAAWAIYANTGQVCSAGSRLLVEEGAYDALVDSLAQVAGKIPVGHGLSEGVRMGPLISDEQLQRVMGYVSRGREEGATVLAGGERVGSEGYFLAPTALADVDRNSPLWREEIFGPVVCATKFGDLDEAVDIANDSNYGLAAGVFTRDLSRAHYLADRLQVGTVWVNTYNLFDPAVPWGGFKESGIGHDNGRTAMDAYTEEKVVWMGLG